MTVISPWSECQIGDVRLSHRVVLAPLTRGRASKSTSSDDGAWVPNDLMKEYYVQRATPGGLLISEATPVSRRASGLNGVPGWFTDEQVAGWRDIIGGVHEKGGVFFTQLWHQGRNTHSIASGQQPESSSAVGMSGNLMWSGHPSVPFETPKAMSKAEIEATQEDFVNAAKRAIEAGCDGVEIHAGNGYLFDQFHHSNVNQRTDDYGGSIENRCRFTLETVDKICTAIGGGRFGVRLSPYGLFNEVNGENRMEQWTYLCSELDKRGLAYVHLIEPRFDEFKSATEKLAFLGVDNTVSLAPFRAALTRTKLLSAGGFSPLDFAGGIARGEHDLVAFGRYFTANADLVPRLKSGEPLYKWDRTRFYGPFPDNEVGYTVHPTRILAGEMDSAKAQMAD